MAQSDTACTPTVSFALAGPQRDPLAVLALSTFGPGIELLPHDLREDARQLYRVLRTIDDLVDEDDPTAEERVAAIESWAYGVPSDTPETCALTDLAQRYPLSPQTFVEFCDGMRHDLAGTTIDTEADLLTYCRQVGGTVGDMLASLLGTANPTVATKMSTLGTAMQWTNILRDIDEDHARGRLYIARTTIARFGFPSPGSRCDLLRDQISRVDALYEEGLGALPLLVNGRGAMSLSVALYREILRQIEREGYGREAGQVVVPAWRRQQLIAEHS